MSTTSIAHAIGARIRLLARSDGGYSMAKTEKQQNAWDELGKRARDGDEDAKEAIRAILELTR